jgi:hypothetical protein
VPLSRFRKVVIFCPLAITGGPEAIHQLSLSLSGVGVDCWIIHVGGRQETQLRSDRLVLKTPPHEGMAKFYEAYGPRFRTEIELDAETLVVLPEVLARHNRGLTRCGVAIWWLSVDNAMRRLESVGGVDPEAELGQILTRPDVIHFYQSAYARDWLRSQDVERIYDLGDYTSPLFTAAMAKEASPKPAVSYNGAKGAEIAESFFASAPGLDALALRGFSKPELQEIFRERLLYVDFGHFPGKDRLPREAAAAGCVVFVRKTGAAAVYEDFPLPDAFKFTDEDVASGELMRRLEAVIAEPQAWWARQDQFRSRVAWEKAQFHDQVMRLWGVRRMV